MVTIIGQSTNGWQQQRLDEKADSLTEQHHGRHIYSSSSELDNTNAVICAWCTIVGVPSILGGKVLYNGRYIRIIVDLQKKKYIICQITMFGSCFGIIRAELTPLF